MTRLADLIECEPPETVEVQTRQDVVCAVLSLARAERATAEWLIIREDWIRCVDELFRAS